MKARGAISEEASVELKRYSIMGWSLHGGNEQLLMTYGYWALGGVIGLESLGLPLPGESALVAAALYAGSTHQLNIGILILAAAVGAVAGSVGGFVVGRGIGARRLAKYGRYIYLNEKRLKLGRYLFWRHGGKVVFFSRFVAVLRSLAAILAGVNQMPWLRFLLFNVLGGVFWAGAYGMAAYAFGDQLKEMSTPIGIASFVAAAAVIGGSALPSPERSAAAARSRSQIPKLHPSQGSWRLIGLGPCVKMNESAQSNQGPFIHGAGGW